MVDNGFSRVAGRLVDNITDRARQDWDLDAVRKLKTLCKTGGEPAVLTVFELIMGRLKEQHAQTRLHAISLANVFVSRSAVFRSLLADNFTQFLECSIGHKSARPLPPPAQEATQLRQRALEYVEGWTEEYGDKLPQMKMGHHYLQHVVKLKFPQLRSQQAAREAEAAAREERSRALNEERFQAIREKHGSVLAEIGSTLDEMEAAFRLLEGRADPLAQADDDDWEDVAPQADRDEANGYGTRPAGGTGGSVPILQNADPTVLETLRGSYKVLVGRHLPTMLEWLKVAVKADAGQPGSSDGNQRAHILKACISARDRISSAKLHCEALMSDVRQKASAGETHAPMVIQASTEDPSSSSYRIAVREGAHGAGSAGPPGLPRSQRDVLQKVFGSDSDEDEPSAPAQPKRNPQIQPKLAKRSRPVYHDPTYRHPEAAIAEQKAALATTAATLAAPPPSAPAASASKKSRIPSDLAKKLLDEAPVLPGGMHLAYWDSDSASLLNNKGMEVYNHWGAVDENVQLPESVISQFFTTRASYYDPTQKEQKRPRVEDTVEEEPAEPPKKVPKVTAIGLPAPSRPPLPPLFPRSTAASSSAPKSSKDAATKQVLPVSAGKPDSGADRGMPQRRGRPTGKRAEKDKASQRAADRAHNEAILAGASGGDQELALQLTTTDTKGNGKSSSKKGGSVRQRLAAKLFSGKVVERAISEQEALESERMRDQDSHRFVT